jgi:hypothetical protein
MNWITTYEVNEATTTRKSDPNIIFLLLATIGIILIGLTITNVPIVYSEESSGKDDKDGKDGDDKDGKDGDDKDGKDGDDKDGKDGDDKDECGDDEGGDDKEGDDECGDENDEDGGGDEDSEDSGDSGDSVDVIDDGGSGVSDAKDGGTKDRGAKDGDAKAAKDNGDKFNELVKGHAGLTALLTAAKAFGYDIPTPGPNKPPTSPAATQISYGLSANYPSKWRIDMTDSDLNDGLIEVAHIYPSSRTDEKVEIGIDDKTASDLTLEGYLKSTTDIHQKNFGGIIVLETDTSSTVAGKPAYRIIFTPNDKTSQIMETGFILGDKVYHITYTAKPETYLSYLPDVQNLVNSLRISK